MAAALPRHHLHALVWKGKLKQIKELLSQDPDAVSLINEPAGVFAYAPIHEAVSGRKADILRVLLAYGGNVDLLCNGGYTPLHLAASIGEIDCIRVLLEFDADLSICDVCNRTPFETAQVHRKNRAARLLKTHEIKILAKDDKLELREMLQRAKRGQDIEESCLEDALEIAVNNGNRNAIGLLVYHGARNLEKCMHAALLKSRLQEVSVLLLLLYAAKVDDKELVRVMCSGLPKDKESGAYSTHMSNLTRKYLPKEWNETLTKEKLREMRESVYRINMDFPVAVAFRLKRFDITWIFLKEIYCKAEQGEAIWKNLKLSYLLPNWIKGIINYNTLKLSHNLLEIFPREITDMKSLMRLDLSKNSIQEVPKELFELKNLRNLDLSSNQIQFLPKVNEWSKSIKILNLSDNWLRFLDSSIEDSELEDLDLSSNELSKVPSSICEIHTLLQLNLSRNRNIKVLPPELAKLSKLYFLRTEEMDQITDPPTGLRGCTDEILAHLRAKLRNSKPYYTMKLMIVGLMNRGKTTLMHRINKDFVFNTNASTQGVAISEIAINHYTFKCWDFAGQEEYYATHQCFLTQRSLYMLVWNVEDGDEGIMGLKPWLDNLQFRVPFSSLIIVGTHLDKIDASSRTEAYENEIIDKVYNLVLPYKEINCQKPMIMLTTCSIARDHLQDCKTRSDRLRDLITKVAVTMTVDGKPNSQKVMGEKVPSSYLTLAKMIEEKRTELEKEGKLPLLRRCEFEDLIQEITSKNTQDYFDPEDANIATEFLHSIGIILHYNDPNKDLRDLYFISPSWLCDLMAKVVTVREAHSFIRDGMLCEKDIPFIIDESRRFPKEFYPKYLRLLARFQIACRVDSERILIPSRLPLAGPSKSTTLYEHSNTLTRIHSFSCIPHGFWSRFISRFLLYLNDMLNVTPEKPSQSWQDQTRHEDQDLGRDSSDESREGGIESSSDWSQTERAEFLTKSNETEAAMPPSANKVTEAEVEAEDGCRTDGFIIGSKLINGIHYADEITSDGDEPSAVVGSRINAKSPVGYPKCTSPPIIVNNFRFEQDVSSCDASPPSDDDRSSRNITPISLDRDSSLSSHCSTPIYPHTRVSSSNMFDESDCIRSQPNGASSESQTREYTESPRRNDDESSNSKHNFSCGSENFGEEAEGIFDEPVDLPYLLSRRYLICWRNGLRFKHPSLYLSVSMIHSDTGRELVETKVSRSVLGYRALAFIVDHIRTLVKEWFPGLDGTDGVEPYVSQLVPCPICLDLGVSPPYNFNVANCLKDSLTRDYMVCGNTHTPKVVKLSELCPEILFMDLESSMQLNAANLRYEESENSLLGSGQFGKVYHGRYDGKDAAVKIFNFEFEENPFNHEALDHFYEVRQEAVVLSRITYHPNVISFYGVAARPKFCIVIELAMHGTLRDALRSETIDRIVIYRIAQQVADAVAHLHSRGIIHRDLKSDNILLFSLDKDSEVNVKLTDFGTANFMNSTGLKFFIGTPGFIAPEIYEYAKLEEYSEMVDVFSYAMVLYELISRRRPFHQARSPHEISDAIKEGKRPIFYDLPNIGIGLLTLTELMLKCWVQEATKRPKFSDVVRQMKSPSFCLLFGKTVLRDVNTPRQLCFVPVTTEIWISCDDRAGASVLVVELVTAKIKCKFIPENRSLSKARESFFNIFAIYDIDANHVAIILRSTLDYVSIYSKDRKRLVDSYQVSDHYIRSLTVSVNHVVLGYDDGSFSVVSKRDFMKGRLEKLSVTVNKRRAISSVVTDTRVSGTIDAKIILGCDKYIYKYPFASPDDKGVKPEMRLTDDKKMICEMHVSEDGKVLFVSHNASPVINAYLVDGLDPMEHMHIDCSHQLKMLVPNCDAIDQRVTSFCVSSDTLWIGTGSGHILVYEIQSDKTSFITWFKPYKLEVRCLVACSLSNTDPSRYVVSIGKEVYFAALCYGRAGLCLLTGSFPKDPSDPTLQRSASKGSCRRKISVNSQLQKDEFDVKKMILIWESPGAATLKKMVE